MNVQQIVGFARRSGLRSVLILGLVPLAAGVAQTGDRTNVRGVGMGRTMNAAARGVDALGVNPSLLALPDNRFMEIGLPTVGFHFLSQFVSYDVYNDYFTGVETTSGDRVAKELTEQDKRDLLNLLPDEGETRFATDIRVLSLSFHHAKIGGMGFGITEHVGMKNNLDKDFFRLPFDGLPSGSTYDLSDTRQEFWWWREYAFSYGREVPAFIPMTKRVFVGAGFKIVRGYGIFETVNYRGIVSNPGFDVNQIRFEALSEFLIRRAGIQEFNSDSSDFTPFPDPAGKGVGFDLGLTAELNYGIRVSAAVVNIGSIDWDQNLVETVGAGNVTISNPLTDQGNDSLLIALRGSNRPGEAFSTPLPTQLRIGATMRSDEVPFLKWLPGRLALAVDYTQGFNESLGNSTQPRFSLGTEYRLIPLIPLRTGIAWGGGDSFRWAAGIGLDLHFLSLDLATENIGVLTSLDNFSMFQFSAGLKIKI
jgi:hypothetical protein